MSKDKFFDVNQHWDDLADKYDIEIVGPKRCAEILSAHLKYTDFTHPSAQHICTVGEPGTGKTVITENVCRQHNFYPLTCRLSNVSEGVIDGFPVPLRTEKTIELQTVTQISDQINTAINNNQPIAVFFDEINRASQRKLNSVFNIVDRKVWGGLKLPEDTTFFLSINPSTDAHDVLDIFKDAAFNRRFKLLGMRPNVDDFIEYADTQANFHWTVKEYVKNKPQMLEDLSRMYSKGKKYSCAAALDGISRILTSFEKDSIPLATLDTRPDLCGLLYSSIGKHNGMDLVNFIVDSASNITPEKVLQGYDMIRDSVRGKTDDLYAAQGPAIDPSQLTSLCNDVATYIVTKDIDFGTNPRVAENFATFIGDVGNEPLSDLMDTFGTTYTKEAGKDGKLEEMHEALKGYDGYKDALTRMNMSIHRGLMELHK